MAETSYQISGFIILQSREAFISFNIESSAIFSNEKKYNEAFQGVYFLRIREKTLSSIS